MAKSLLFRECIEFSRQALLSDALQDVAVARSRIKDLLKSGNIVGREAKILREMRRSLHQAFTLELRKKPDLIFADVLRYLDRVQTIAAYKSQVNERRLLRIQRYLDLADETLRQFGTLQFSFDQLAMFRPKICAIENARILAMKSLHILQRRFSCESRI